MGKDLRHPKRLFPRRPATLTFIDKIEVPETIYNRDKAKEETKALIEEELELEREDRGDRDWEHDNETY